MNKLSIILLLLLCSIKLNAQQFLGKNGEISFFSEAPMEDISAINNKVSAVFDSNTNDLVFQLNVIDFIFPKPLMQEHFNENYLESDIYPTSVFEGKVIDAYIKEMGDVRVEGNLTIHGVTKKISVEGLLLQRDDVVSIKADFVIRLKDYKIKIPKIVMYNIAEKIDISVNIELSKIK